MSDTPSTALTPKKFSDLGLSTTLLNMLDSIGYETPSPIQQKCIVHLLNGKDVIGQAQTGTGKTAAFALPLLDKINLSLNAPQLLILTPTRELAIQVSEAVQTYARGMKGFHVLPIYGGQSYDIQLRPLKRGVHCVVGTPGRVMDHIKRGTLKVNNLKLFVLDEADEMLKMGFIDDIKWVMGCIPDERQIALFSATMPTVIKEVAEKFLNHPQVVKIKTKTETAATISQKYMLVNNMAQKLNALTRILEVTTFDAMIIFVRTKTMTVELEEKVSARGFSASAINGDIAQNQRERIINNFKKGKLDILIATDVAARGLDVERISHVLNFDIPQDPESYVHRIGRTGRAGRTGEAILFVTYRERGMLKTIERITRQTIDPIELPSAKTINTNRIDAFKQRITETLNNQNMDLFEKLVMEYINTHEGVEPLKIAASLAFMAQGNESFLLSEKEPSFDKEKSIAEKKTISLQATPLKKNPQTPMLRYRIEVGHQQSVKPGNILGAISNKAKIDRNYIGAIQIFENFSTIDLPDKIPKEIFELLQKTVVCGKPLNITELNEKNNKTYIAKKRKHNFGSKKFVKNKGEFELGKSKPKFSRNKVHKSFS